MSEVLEKIAFMHSNNLIEKAIHGDQRAYDKLVGLWYKKIYNFSLKYFANHDLAMEATQQTFIVAYKGIQKLRDVESFRFWLYKIALNHCRDEDRRNKRRKWFSIHGLEETKNFSSIIGNPEIEIQKKEKSELIAGYITMLPAEQKEVILMKEFEGMKFREMAEALDTSENTVKSRLYYGLNALRKLMKNSEMKY
ncbi:MAG: sigma-70 family RNA polymerase sigma factor [Cyclobacteriaceae bacterium]|nr:sigma-70 family RNA polymerase sigma factor [Cyclobacteriaceae bacterium]